MRSMPKGRGQGRPEAGVGDETSGPTMRSKGIGKYMHTPDHGNDQRRPEDGPVGIKSKFLNYPGK